MDRKAANIREKRYGNFQKQYDKAVNNVAFVFLLVGLLVQLLDQVDTSITQCRRHAFACSLAVGRRQRDVVRIAAHAKTDQFGVDSVLRALWRTQALFEHDTPGAVTQDEASTRPPLSKGRLARVEIVVTRGHRPRGTKVPHCERRGRELRAAGEHDLGITMLDTAGRQADARAGAGHRR